MSTKVRSEIETFLRSLLADRLSQVSSAQREFFRKLHPGEVVPYERLENAIDLCDRTIKKNLENPDRMKVQP